MGMTITGGTYNNIEYGAMYDNNWIIFHYDRYDGNKKLVGVEGYVQYVSPNSGTITNLAPAMVWLNEQTLEFESGERYLPTIDKTLSEFVEESDNITYITESLEPFVDVENYPDTDFYKECFEIGLTEKFAKRIGAYFDMYTTPVVRFYPKTRELLIGVASSGGCICSFAPLCEKNTFSDNEIITQRIFFNYLIECFGVRDDGLGRVLSPSEKDEFVNNRKAMLDELNELQADFEDLSDEDLVTCRESMSKRINRLLSLALETDEDNL